jgi:hypothetical protein
MYDPYQSEEAARLLGHAFLPLLPGLKGAGAFSMAWLPFVKPIAYLLYRVLARHRYRLFW